VYLCHKKSVHSELSIPEEVIQKCAGVRELRADGVVLDTGEFLAVDAVILCTGYWYSFPFLSTDSCLEVTAENVVNPLYKHLIHAHYPTMSFIGIPKKILPFPMFHCQVQFVLAQLSGKMVLPGFSAMEEDVRKCYTEYVEMGNCPRHFHDMGSLQWQYYDWLASSAGFEPLPRVICRIYSHCAHMRLANFASYRSHNFEIIDNNSFIEI
jgi:Flavin-binding monooxygenase-like